MSRSKGDMASLQRIFLVAALHLAICRAGPVGPLPNVTSSDLGLSEGSCSAGGATYSAGAAVPGSGPCERCSCAGGEVRCARDRCDPRPGCKPLHRPDQCCPTYQCDCEQDGRVYANGEKLVDAADPCRVCYCQGGEVVCRRIACFLRDDCRPRLVPGRCCPEYDNCPLRGVTSPPGVSSPSPSVSSIEEMTASPSAAAAAPAPPKEPVKQEITIKEITPVSEIPIKTDVKIKEIISPADAEAVEYPSSKSPLIPREATSERAPDVDVSPDLPDVKASTALDSAATDLSTTAVNVPSAAKTDAGDSSKIILSTEDSSDIYASKVPNIIPLMGVPATMPAPATTRAPIIEEEEVPLDNPAFPPIPDDLSVMGNHEDDQNIENEQPSDHDVVNVTNKPMITVSVNPKETATSSSSSIAGIDSSATERSIENTSDTIKDIPISTQSSASSESTMLDLRSVIPKEILDAPSLISNESTGELLDVTESSTKGISEKRNSLSEVSTESEPTKIENLDTSKELSTSVSSNEAATTATDGVADTTDKQLNLKDNALSSTTNLGEITSQTEFSSLPIETSDQNPHGIVDKDESDKVFLSTTDSPVFPSLPTKYTSDSEVITLLAEVPAAKDDRSYEYVETTEFIVTPYYSEESATEAVELIKISPDGQESSSIILRPKGAEKSNVLNDLINLVGDVASMPDHTGKPDSEYQTSAPAALNSNSEELIPVNAGYKSKNNNWNLNSITEQPYKNKNVGTVTKQKVVEIEDEESDTITDSPPPNDRAEPTTRRPIIDNVSDGADNETDKSNKKDIEIITQSYVPTINKRPTKVILQEESDSSEVKSSASAETPKSSEISTTSQTTPAPQSVEQATPVPDNVSGQTTDAAAASE